MTRGFGGWKVWDSKIGLVTFGLVTIGLYLPKVDWINWLADTTVRICRKNCPMISIFHNFIVYWFSFVENHWIIGFSIFSLISLGLQNIFSSLSGSKSSKSNSFRERREESSAPHPPWKKNLLWNWYFQSILYGAIIHVVFTPENQPWIN